jgi:LysM repeat protein
MISRNQERNQPVKHSFFSSIINAVFAVVLFSLAAVLPVSAGQGDATSSPPLIPATETVEPTVTETKRVIQAKGETTSTVEEPKVVTLTAMPDGSIVHKVAKGVTLWDLAIAYGLHVTDLVTYNRLSPSNPIIYEGQNVVIQPSYTPTKTATITNTPPPPTRTPRPTLSPRPTQPTHTPQATFTATTPPLMPKIPSLEGISRRSLAITMIIVSALGLLILFALGTRGKKQP